MFGWMNVSMHGNRRQDLDVLKGTRTSMKRDEVELMLV